MVVRLRRARKHVGAARIEEPVVAVQLHRTVKAVRPRLGEDLDPAEAGAIVLRGEGILIDADLADRRLRRKLSAGEAVDIDLSAVWTGRRPGKRGELGRELVRVV